MLGRAPIVDFDGTVASLPVDWSQLRSRLGVDRIDDLWRAESPGWDEVTRAECAAATVAPEVEVVTGQLARSEGCAILTSNSERAVEVFLSRTPSLAPQVRTVVGRETLSGPKADFETFRRGFDRCVQFTAAIRGTEPIVYVGDQTYEIDFAERLGAQAFIVENGAIRKWS